MSYRLGVRELSREHVGDPHLKFEFNPFNLSLYLVLLPVYGAC